MASERNRRFTPTRNGGQPCGNISGLCSSQRNSLSSLPTRQPRAVECLSKTVSKSPNSPRLERNSHHRLERHRFAVSQRRKKLPAPEGFACVYLQAIVSIIENPNVADRAITLDHSSQLNYPLHILTHKLKRISWGYGSGNNRRKKIALGGTFIQFRKMHNQTTPRGI